MTNVNDCFAPATFGHIEFLFHSLKIVQPIITTGLSLAVLVTLPTLAVSAPAGLAQTNHSEAAAGEIVQTEGKTASPTASQSATSRDFVERIEAAKQTEEQWRQVVAQDPRNAEAYRNLASALADLNRYRDAEAIYQRAIQLDQTDEASYIAFGQFLQAQTRPYEAAMLYQQMTALMPDSAIAYEQLADSLSRVSIDDWPTLNADIEAAYRQSIRLNPEKITPYYGLGEHLARQNRFAEAVSLMREIIRLNPDEDSIYATLAAIPTRNQEPAAAAVIYQEGLSAQPDNPAIYISFANWLMEQNRSPEAEALYRSAIDRGITDNATLYSQLGDLLLSQSRSAEAKAVYEQAILLSPETSNYGKLGAILNMTEGVDATIALYQRAIQNPRVEDKGYFYTQIGHLLQDSGRTDDAIATYRQGLNLTDSASIARPLADLLLAQQQYDEARSLYERFKSSFGTDPEALQNWQAALRGLGRAEEAERLSQDLQPRLARAEEGLYRRAIAISPESGYFYDLLGDALYQQDKTKQAEAAYQEALRLNYGVFKTRIKLGRLLFEQGKMEQAEAIYLQALDRAPQVDLQYFVQDRAQLYQYLGELYEATHRPLLAIESYRKVLEIDTSKVSARERIAVLSATAEGNGKTTSASVEANFETQLPDE